MAHYRVTLKTKADQIKGIEAVAKLGPVQCYPGGRIIVNDAQLAKLIDLGVIKLQNKI